ncbi:hypothetical protein HOY80DRAFT_1006579 [Tuber brumale]|nr:hypothetical protein HOY80DRAFT_1006579 [Tuber brumale]
MSSSSKNLFVRGSSPAAGIAFAMAGNASDPNDILESSEHSISVAGSMNELILTMPSRYLPLLAPILREMQDVHDKLCNARRGLATLEGHQTAGTWPPYIAGMHNPFDSVQITKVARSATLPSLEKARTWFRLQKEEALSRVIEIKQAEVDALAKNCSPATVGDLMLTELNMDWESLKKALGKSTAEVDEEGKPLEKPLGINIPKFFHREIALARKLVPVWVAKSWDFTRIKSTKLSKELEKKHALAAEAAASADVEMGGMDSSVPISKTVADAVDAALRQRNKPGMSKQRGGSRKYRSIINNCEDFRYPG